MQPTDKDFTLKDTAQLLLHLRRSEKGEAAVAELSPQMALLRSWQAERLSRTYADLRADPQYSALYRFFLEDIYAPRDFSQRNLDGERLYQFLRRFFPAQALHAMALTLELNALTEQLDRLLLNTLVEQVGVSDTITEALYAEAYRLCDNYADRLEQITLITAVARRVERFARMPFVAPSLRLARGPARQAGLSELHGFFERGLNALKDVADCESFLRVIQERERRILDNIFAGEPEPFAL